MVRYVTTAAIAVAAAMVPFSGALAQSTASDSVAIRSVMKAFDNAIQNKDLPALTALFYDGKIVWRSTGFPQSRDFAAKISGKPVPEVEDQGAHELITDPRVQKLHLRETFGQPTIVTDGQLATVTFDYDFRVNDSVQNWGSESWQMAKTANGWKIVHLLFSYNVEQVQSMSLTRGGGK